MGWTNKINKLITNSKQCESLYWRCKLSMENEQYTPLNILPHCDKDVRNAWLRHEKQVYLEADEASSSNSRQLDNEEHMYNASAVVVSQSGLIVLVGDVVSCTCNEVWMRVTRITL